MKRTTIILLCLSVVTAMRAQSFQQELTVGDERELIEALGSNRIVNIKDSAELNLTRVLNNKSLFRKMGFLWKEDYYDERRSASELKVSCERFDGRQLDLVGVRNLTIRGGKGCKLVVEPRYANVLNFYNCNNIRIERLTIGHTDEGYCEGGVIYAENSENISIANCDLYGCGTYGLEARDCRKISMIRTVIHDCSYGIMQIIGSHDCTFTDCDFVRCREFDLVTVGGNSQGTRFTRCRFAENKGTLFNLRSPIRVESCEIHHPKAFELGDVENGNFGYGDQNTTFYRDDEPLQQRAIGTNYEPKPQNKPSAQQLVDEIRKKYAQVKETQEYKKKAELPPDETVITSNYMAAGAGPVKDVTRYYYNGDFDEDQGQEMYKTYFMVRKFNVGALDFYQEYLLDDESELIFFYEKSGTNETRYYWNKLELIKQDIKGEATTDETSAIRLSSALLNAFNLLMNREF